MSYSTRQPFNFYRLKREWSVEKLDTFFMDFSYNKVELTAVYSKIENSILLLKKNANGIDAELDIPLIGDFQIDTYLGTLYQDLASFLEVKYDPNNAFRPFNFFKHFDDTFKARSYANKKEVGYLNRKRNLEDPDAIYYLRLVPHEGKNNGNVTKKNLEKTKWLLPKFYAKHKNDNISVAYTADPSKEKPIPKEYQ
ncbi:DUF6037 family protein [Leuconostocaceae bacterium ESL0958]|nr:DUF6037 family protein [Leuconostocaceae bacterium ESL0958]